jgi:o-succinylbenzoate synthase
MQVAFQTITFDFRFPAGTSRGVLLQKVSSFLKLTVDGITGIGECSTIPGLSPDPEDTYFSKLKEVCEKLQDGISPSDIDLQEFPSIQFGLETALSDLKTGGKQLLFPSSFTEGKAGIPINGLIWMGDKSFMQQQIKSKLAAGFRCLKMKIGAIDFESELAILMEIRRNFSPKELELRLDANGAFTPDEALVKLEKLAAFHIHSIEQPILQGQYQAMEKLCANSPVPVALDEELISFPLERSVELLRQLKPAYIILKPSLLGGFKNSEKWIEAAHKTNTGWWVTSALESNIGLNAIAQWTATLNNPMPQGLGTGQLYHNNIESPLEIRGAELWYDSEKLWSRNL